MLISRHGPVGPVRGWVSVKGLRIIRTTFDHVCAIRLQVVRTRRRAKLAVERAISDGAVEVAGHDIGQVILNIKTI
jgi:hypothetical protein